VNQKKSGHPSVYVIAEPNGAGKTTFARMFLPAYADCKNFVNADLIAQGVSPFSPETAAIKAGKLMLNEIEGFAQRRVDFGFETTLSGLAHLNLIRRLKRRRYKTNIFYLWVPSADAALSRVRERVSSGGHDIPERIVRRRFDRSIRNFLGRYRKLADSWTLFNNSSKAPSLIALENGSGLRIVDKRLYSELIARYGTK
jgi:predicted ABC-type ATPase